MPLAFAKLTLAERGPPRSAHRADQQVQRMLAVRAGFAPVDRPRLVAHLPAVQGHMLAVALHRQLLKVGGKALQVLFVGQDRHGLRAQKVVIPDGKEAHQHRQVILERGIHGNARPSRGTPSRGRGSWTAQSQAWSRGRSPSPSNNARRPSCPRR